MANFEMKNIENMIFFIIASSDYIDLIESEVERS